MSRGEPSSSREPWPRGCAARDRISSSFPISPPGQPQCDDVTGGGRAVRQHHSTRALTRGGNKFLPFWPFWFWVSLWEPGGFPGDSVGKGSSCSAGDPGSIPWVGKIPWRSAWQPAPVSWPGESHGQRSLVATVHGVAMSQMRLK